MKSSSSTRSPSQAASDDRRSTRAIDLNAFVPAMLTNLSQKITTTASAVYRPRFGVGITDWRIMALLAAEPWIVPVRICEATGLDKAAVSRSLRELITAGLAEALDDGVAQRRLPVALTQKGLQVHDDMALVAAEREELLLKGLSAEERATLRGLITRMQGAFDGVEAETPDIL
jgi:DNA-binding MarR family transcriptional regulator